MKRAAPLLAVPVLAVFVFLASAWPTRLSMVDDAYVSARYAAHLAAGHGLVYNAGLPPVEGYTDFLWVLLMAPGTRLPIHYATWATGWGLVFGALTILFAGALTGRLVPRGSPWAFVPAVALALLPHFAIAATNGLETSLFVAGVLGAAWVTRARPGPEAGVLSGLLYLIRPEGLVVGAWFAGWSAWRSRSVRPVVGWGALVVPYFLARTAYFGTWIPNTWNAQAREGLADVWAMNWPYFAEAWPVWVGVGPLLLLTVVGLMRPGSAVGPGGRADLVLLLVPAAILLLVSIQVYNWMPGLRLLLAPIALVLVAASRVAAQLPGRWPSRVLTAAGAAWLLWLTLGPPRAAASGYDAVTTVLPDNGGERLGRTIAKAAPPGAWLLIRDAGVVPYYAGLAVHVIDIHPYSLTDPALTGRAFDLDHVLDRDVYALVTTGKALGEDTVYLEERRLLLDPRVRRRFERGVQVRQHEGRYFTLWSPR